MRRIKKAVTSVSSTSTSELVIREAKCNKTEFCATSECPDVTALGNGLGLDDAGNYHNANSGM